MTNAPTGKTTAKALAAAARAMFARGLSPTAKVSVGKVVLPLHMKPAKTKAKAKTNAQNRLLHHMAMQEMAGTNWQGQPRGFRIAPTSRKNKAFHNPNMLTRVEGLAKAAGMTA